MLTSGGSCAGMALLFYSLKPTGESDTASMHTGCPVIEGVLNGRPPNGSTLDPSMRSGSTRPNRLNRSGIPSSAWTTMRDAQGMLLPETYGVCRPSCLQSLDKMLRWRHETLWSELRGSDTLQILNRRVNQPMDCSHQTKEKHR